MFSKKIKYLSSIFIIICFYTTPYAQDKEGLIHLKGLDSLQKTHYGSSTEASYIIYHKTLKQALRLDYKKGIAIAYKSLMWYHGAKPDRDLDSMLYYADLFETKTATFNQPQDSLLKKELELPQYYLNKGQLLTNGFGLPDQGLESYFNVYPLIPKGNTKLIIDYYVAISEIYYKKSQHDKALEILTPLLKDTIGIGYFTKNRILCNISANYVQKEMPKKSLSIHKNILKLAKANNDSLQVWWTKNSLTNDYFRLGNVEKAIDSALVVRAQCFKKNYHQIIYNNTIYLSTYYHAIGDLKTAIAYRKEALQYVSGFEMKKDLYNKLALYYSENKQYNDAIAIYKKKAVLVDSIRLNEKRAVTNYIDSNVKLLKEKQKSQQMHFNVTLLEEKNKKQKLYLFSISTALISVILLLGSILIFRKYRKGEKVIEILKSNEKKLLEEQITLRENELEASAIALSQRLVILTSIKDELNEIKKPQIPKLEKAKLKINNLIQSASDMSIITKRIESEYPTITAKLTGKFPNLTDTQIRYCLLTKLNLSIKETSVILNVTPDTVKVARSRLKKKLGVPSEMTIKMFLDRLAEE